MEDAVSARRDRLTTLEQDHGRLEERRATLDRIAARVEEAKDRLAAARDAARLNEELARALGRDGVQAMLIEQSLPELERIANALLDQLTEGRGHTQVSLHTQRENASGKTVETLDIHISDDLGTRDYEMYSGGEKFRVDFALRIALSRLLACAPALPCRRSSSTRASAARTRRAATASSPPSTPSAPSSASSSSSPTSRTCATSSTAALRSRRIRSAVHRRWWCKGARHEPLSVPDVRG